MVVFVPLLPLSGYAHVPTKPSDHTDSHISPLSGYAHVPTKPSDHTDSHKINNFSLGPQEILAMEEQASQIKVGLEHLGAGDIQRMFILPTKESVPSESSESEGMVRVAFLDTSKKCFVYDSMTKEMVLCDEEDTVLVRDSEEVLASSLSSYAPVDSSFIPRGYLQTAGLGDFICAYETEIKIGVTAGVVGAIIGGLIGATGPMLIGMAGALGIAGMIIIPEEEIGKSLVTLIATSLATAGVAVGAGVLAQGSVLAKGVLVTASTATSIGVATGVMIWVNSHLMYSMFCSEEKG